MLWVADWAYTPGTVLNVVEPYCKAEELVCVLLTVRPKRVPPAQPAQCPSVRGVVELNFSYCNTQPFTPCCCCCCCCCCEGEVCCSIYRGGDDDLQRVVDVPIVVVQYGEDACTRLGLAQRLQWRRKSRGQAHRPERRVEPVGVHRRRAWASLSLLLELHACMFTECQ